MQNIVATIDNTDSHHGEQVVGESRVIIYTSEESGRCVSTDGSLHQVCASRVLLNERRNIVDESVDNHERSVLGFREKVVPRDNGELVRVNRPSDSVLLFFKFLKLHRELTLLDLVVGELLEVRCETKELHGPDEPLGRVVLEPSNRVTEVHRELVVEVVVSFTDSHKRCDEVVSRGVLVVERSIAEPVSK